ncbi:MAG: hypothetical protein HY795_02265 [Desulfovibrio sp.]|nr:hypothetical protein [Desulfovibrio sp.]MBI4961160.1 hypothetical protein [Desulfovibrio sp.]
MQKILLIAFSFCSLFIVFFGFSPLQVQASAPVTFKVSNHKFDGTALYFDKAIQMIASDQTSEIAAHRSHYSHKSHKSHVSHRSGH